MLKPGELNNLFIQTHHMHYRGSFKNYAELGIGEGQPRLLRILAEETGISQVELSKRCHLEPATVTVTLGRLEKMGLVERKTDTNDRRIMRIRLTKKGEEITVELSKLFLQFEEKCFTNFSAEEREQMADFLRRMQENLGR